MLLLGLVQAAFDLKGSLPRGCGGEHEKASVNGVMSTSSQRPVLRPCPGCFPLPEWTHTAVFFSFRFSSVLSLSLSLFLFFFFFWFFFQKIKARKGEGAKEKAQEKPVQTAQLSL